MGDDPARIWEVSALFVRPANRLVTADAVAAIQRTILFDLPERNTTAVFPDSTSHEEMTATLAEYFPPKGGHLVPVQHEYADMFDASLVGKYRDVPVLDFYILGGDIFDTVGTVGTSYDTYRVALTGDRKFLVKARHQPTAGELVPLLQQIYPWPQWQDVEAASRGLTWSNGRILRAKAMQSLSVKPNDVSPYEWEEHFELAQHNLSVCTKAGRIWRSAGFGVLAVVITTPLTWLALLILAWIWYFLLDRLSELSRAIRGKMGE